jgi:predicted nucleic acid-binding protein
MPRRAPLCPVRGARLTVNGTWIAATALAHGVPVVSPDHDHVALADISGLQVIAV